MKVETIWIGEAKTNEARRKNTPGAQSMVYHNQVETTSFLCLTRNMNHQSAERTRKDQQ